MWFAGSWVRAWFDGVHVSCLWAGPCLSSYPYPPMPSGAKYLFLLGLGRAESCKYRLTNGLVAGILESVVYVSGQFSGSCSQLLALVWRIQVSSGVASFEGEGLL